MGNILLDIFKTGGASNGNVYFDARNGSFGSDSSRAHNFGSQFANWGAGHGLQR
jgi:hypothetical protein